MTSTLIDRLNGISEGLAVKAACRCATSANVTLAGLQTIDGVTVIEGDAVLVKNNSDPAQNGPYLASSGNWTRRSDFDGARDVAYGTRIFVIEGTANGNREFFLNTAAPVIGSTGLTFSSASQQTLASAASAYIATLAAAQLSAISADTAFVVTGGYSQVGDLGGGFYAQVVSQPSHGGKFQSANGLWFELIVREASVRQFGASVSANNTSAVQAAFNYGIAKGVPVVIDGYFKCAGPFTITGTPTIKGRNRSLDGLIITGTSGGITINCTPTTDAPASGGDLVLRDFSLDAGAAGSGAALTVNFAAQTVAHADIPTLTMENVGMGADDLTAHYWSSGATIKNGQAMTFRGNWAAGQNGGYSNTSHWLKLTNDAGVVAQIPIIDGNIFYGSSKAIWMVWTGALGIEGAVLTNNVLVTNDYAFYIDGSGASYVAPYFTFDNNQSESYVASKYLNKVSQFWIDHDVAYIDGASGNGYVLINSDIGKIGAGCYALCTLGSPSSGSAVKSQSTGHVTVGGGVLQNFAKGIDLDASSDRWVVHAFETITVATPVSNLGAQNIVISKDVNYGQSLNGLMLGGWAMSGDEGDANVSQAPGAGHLIIRFNTPLTTNRTVSVTGTWAAGTIVRVVRQGGASGGFTVTFTPTGKSLAINTWCDNYFDGSGWALVASGSL